MRAARATALGGAAAQRYRLDNKEALKHKAIAKRRKRRRRRGQRRGGGGGSGGSDGEGAGGGTGEGGEQEEEEGDAPEASLEEGGGGGSSVAIRSRRSGRSTHADPDLGAWRRSRRVQPRAATAVWQQQGSSSVVLRSRRPRRFVQCGGADGGSKGGGGKGAAGRAAAAAERSPTRRGHSWYESSPVRRPTMAVPAPLPYMNDNRHVCVLLHRHRILNLNVKFPENPTVSE